MFKLEVEDRLSAWSDLRKTIDTSADPFEPLIDFWSHAPFCAHNHQIDPYNSSNWPTPWEIIVENHYDDFTKAIMIGYTLMLTDRFKDAVITVKTLVDTEQSRLYNIVYVDDRWALNYQDNQVVSANNVPSLYRLENLVELKRPR
jgi:hypothetical protein